MNALLEYIGLNFWQYLMYIGLPVRFMLFVMVHNPPTFSYCI